MRTDQNLKPSSEAAVKSASRAIDILEFVAGARQPPSFADIGAALAIPKSSLFHLLATLSGRGYLDGGGGRYRLGPAVEQITASFWRSASLATRVRPLLRELTSRLGETTGYYERRGDEAEAIATERGAQRLTYTIEVGERAPLHAISPGKVLLASLDDAVIDDYARRVSFEPITPNTLASPEALWRDIASVRADGFGRARGEYAVGVVGLAVPLKLGARTVGAICVALPEARYGAETDVHIRAELMRIAARFARWTNNDGETDDDRL